MATAWQLTSRPNGMPTTDNFELPRSTLPALDDGMVRVANRWLSVDPYMRGRMNDVKSYVPPFAIGEPMEGGAVGEVVESRPIRLRRRRHGPAHGRLARRSGVARRQALNKLPRPRRRAAGVPRQSRPDRRDRLFRAARRRRGQGRRHRLRLGRGGRGRIGGRPDRQGQGHDRDRFGRRRRQMRLRPLARRRRGGRLQGRIRCSRRSPQRSRPRASTSISTMSAATISTPRSRSPGRMRASRFAG